MPPAPPKISVIIPAYNRAGDIEPVVKTIMAQTIQDLEIIIVDDASPDEKVVAAIEAMVAAYPAKIRLIKHHTNRGAAAARNTGIMAAKGEFIALLDSDDEWFPNKLEMQLAALTATPDPTTLCICDYLQVPKYGNEKPITLRPSQKPDLKMDILYGRVYNICSNMLIRRSAFNPSSMFDESFNTICEDYDWLIRHILRGANIIAVNEVLTIWKSELKKPYRNHRESLHILRRLHYDNIRKTLGINASRHFMGGIHAHLLFVARQKKQWLNCAYHFTMMALIPPNFFKRVRNYLSHHLSPRRAAL